MNLYTRLSLYGVLALGLATPGAALLANQPVTTRQGILAALENGIKDMKKEIEALRGANPRTAREKTEVQSKKKMLETDVQFGDKLYQAIDKAQLQVAQAMVWFKSLSVSAREKVEAALGLTGLNDAAKGIRLLGLRKELGLQ